MSPQADAFVQALQDDPEDTLLLVFADWLEERGDPRGELLRVQAELARWVPDLQRRTRLQGRERELLSQHARAWLGPLADYCTGWRFERGLAYLTMRARRFVGKRFSALARTWFRRAWVGGVRLTGAEKYMAAVAASPHLADVTELDLRGNGLTADALGLLFGSPHLVRLRRLDLSNNFLMGRGTSVLLASPEVLARLSRLDLRNTVITPWGLALLLEHVDPGRLRWNEVYETDLVRQALRVLTGWREAQKPPADRLWNSLGMEFVRVPAGTFLMGSPASEAGRYDDEDPQHPVTLSRPFYLGAFTVTQQQYEAVTGSNPSHFNAADRGGPYHPVDQVFWEDRGPPAAAAASGGRPYHPVDQVSWEDADEFCRLLSELPEEKERGHTYRLPTEAEWEHACRAGTSTAFSFGQGLSSREANFDGHYPYGGAARGPYRAHTTAVGSYEPNAFGLYDLHGNVWEWCHDWYDEFYYPRAPRTDPRGPRRGDRRALRGGSWFNNGGSCRAAYRYRVEPDQRSSHFGFRVVLVPAGPDGEPPRKSTRARPDK